MVIEFYSNPFSPPSRMVSMTLAALNLPYNSHYVDFKKKEQKYPEFLAMNPRGKVPTIHDGDVCIGESRAISAYLCNAYERDTAERLYPTDAKIRAKVDQLLYISECTYEELVTYTNIRGVLFRGETDLNIDALPGVHKTLSLYETFLTKSTFVAADHLTIADFHMVSPLLLMPISGFDDYKQYPLTVKWLEKIYNLPYYDQCNKAGLEEMDQLYKHLIKTNKEKNPRD